MKLALDNWQKEVLETKGNIALRAGRQVGKSTVISIMAGDYAVKNANKTVMIVAATERQAFLLFEKVLGYITDEYRAYIRTGSKRPTKTKIELKNGSKVYCLPTGLTGYGIRGYTIDLLIADEAAFIPNEVFNAIIPSLSTRIDMGARIVLLSTPFGRDNYFYDCFQVDNFKHFHITSEECGRISKEFLAQEKSRMTEVAYAQEYLGEFADGLMQFFPDDLIRKCMKWQRPQNVDKSKEYFLGSDVARMGEDLSTFEIFKVEDDKLIQVENIVTKKTYLNETTDFIKRLDRDYNFKRLFIDSEGIGVAVYDFLFGEQEYKRRVVGVKNSTRIQVKDTDKAIVYLKEELYSLLLDLMRRGKIEFLQDDDIFYSLRQIRYEYSTDIQGKSYIKIWGKDSHICEGIIRAALGAKWISLNIWIKSIKYEN